MWSDYDKAESRNAESINGVKRLSFKLLLFLLAIVGGAILPSCTSRNRQSDNFDCNDLAPIHMGATVQDVADTSAHLHAKYSEEPFIPLAHHFTIATDEGPYCVMSGLNWWGMPLVFIFRDSTLVQIADPSPSTLVQLRACETTPEEILGALSRVEVADASLCRLLRDRQERWHMYKSGEEPLLLAFVFQAGRDKARERYKRLMARFDASNLTIGQTCHEVDGMYGAPASVTELADETALRIYGIEADIEPFPNPRVYVWLKNGRVSEVQTRYNAPLSTPSTGSTYGAEGP
jgi:hypothetical protein